MSDEDDLQTTMIRLLTTADADNPELLQYPEFRTQLLASREVQLQAFAEKALNGWAHCLTIQDVQHLPLERWQQVVLALPLSFMGSGSLDRQALDLCRVCFRNAMESRARAKA